MKKLKYVVLTFVLSFAFIIGAKAALSDDIAAAEANGADLNQSGVAQIDKIISSDYSFALGQTNELDGEYFGQSPAADISSAKSAWGENALGYLNIVTTPMALATNNAKNTYGVRYKNVGIYNNQYVDIKATVTDFETASSSPKTPIIALNGTSIDNYSIGLKWMKIKYEFFKAGTNIPIVVKGNITYNLTDGKGVLLHDNTVNIFTSTGNTLKTATVGGKTIVFAAESSSNPKGGLMASSGSSILTSFTETFEGDSITRTYQYGNLSDSTIGTEASGVTTTPKAVTEVEIPEPVKGVNKSKVTMGEEFTYTITQVVPAVTADNRYDVFVMDDTLADCLTVDASKVTIKDENGHDVTTKFAISNEGQMIIMTLKNTDDDSFYGHTYNASIKTSIKSGFNMSKYKVGNKYTITNKANVMKNTVIKCSNYVNIEYSTETIKNVPKTFAGTPFYVIMVGIMLFIMSLGTLYYTVMNGKEESGE